MVLKGEWDSGTSYSAGDVVRGEDKVIYLCDVDSPAGVPPTDTLHWERYPQHLDEIVSMMIDVMNKIPTNIDDEGISLKTDDGEYLITVDDSGDTPELDVTAITEAT